MHHYAFGMFVHCSYRSPEEPWLAAFLSSHARLKLAGLAISEGRSVRLSIKGVRVSLNDSSMALLSRKLDYG